MLSLDFYYVFNLLIYHQRESNTIFNDYEGITANPVEGENKREDRNIKFMVMNFSESAAGQYLITILNHRV
jgi:hypothetical protein